MNAQKIPPMKTLMLETVKDLPVWSNTQANFKAFTYLGTGWDLGKTVQTTGQDPDGLWLVAPIGISGEAVSSCKTPTEGSFFFRVLKRCTLKDPLPVLRSHTTEHQWHLEDRELRNKEARPRAHWEAVEEFATERTTVVVTRPPCQPSTRVNASFGLSSCQS